MADTLPSGRYSIVIQGHEMVGGILGTWDDDLGREVWEMFIEEGEILPSGVGDIGVYISAPSCRYKKLEDNHD